MAISPDQWLLDLILACLLIILIGIFLIKIIGKLKSIRENTLDQFSLLFLIISSSLIILSLILFFRKIAKLKDMTNNEKTSTFFMVIALTYLYLHMISQIKLLKIRRVLMVFQKLILLIVILALSKIDVFFYFQSAILDFVSIILLFSSMKQIRTRQVTSEIKSHEHENKTKPSTYNNEWKAMVNEFPIGVVIISKEKNVMFSNKSVQRMFEIDAKEQFVIPLSPQKEMAQSSNQKIQKEPSLLEHFNSTKLNNSKEQKGSIHLEVNFEELDEKIGKLEEVENQLLNINNSKNPIPSDKYHSFSSSNELTIYSHKSAIKKPPFLYHYNSVNPTHHAHHSNSPKNSKTSYSILSSLRIPEKEKQSEKIQRFKEVKEKKNFMPLQRRMKFNTEKAISYKDKDAFNMTKAVKVKNKSKFLTLDSIISSMILKKSCSNIKKEENGVTLIKEVKTYCTQYKNFNKSENQKKKYELKIKTITYKEQDSFLILIEDVSYRDSIAQLRENNDYKNKIMTTLSHEIRTPLNGAIPALEDIYSFIEEDNPLKSSLAVPLKSLYLLQNVLGDAVDFALINSNQLYLNYEENNFFEFMKETVEIFSLQAELKNIEISFNFADGKVPPRKLIADFQRIRQILVSLIGNSLKNTHGGFIDITIEVLTNEDKSASPLNKIKKQTKSPLFRKVFSNEDNEKQEKLVLKFIVEDNGFGIDSEKLEIIKLCLKERNPLEVCNNLNKESGCGLGLTISHCLALILGPRSNKGLWIDSQTNEGTTTEFFIEFYVEKKPYQDFVNALSTIRETKEITRYSTRKKVDGMPTQQSRLGMSRMMTNNSKNSKVSKTSKASKVTSYNFNTERSTKKLPRSQSCELKKSDLVETKGKRKQPWSSQHNTPINSMIFIKKPRQEILVSMGSLLTVGKESAHFIEFQNTHQFVTHNLENLFLKKNVCEKPEKTYISGMSKSTYSHHFDELLKGSYCKCEEALVVDDDAFNLKSLELLLGKFGKKCVKAYNGEEAIQIVQEKYQSGLCCQHCRGFRMIFMDYHMPIKDGVETTKFLKGLMDFKELPFIPIIACTAFGAKDLVERWEKAGMTEFITKPITAKKIEGILEKFC